MMERAFSGASDNSVVAAVTFPIAPSIQTSSHLTCGFQQLSRLDLSFHLISGDIEEETGALALDLCQSPGSALTTCVALSKSLTLSEPTLSPQRNGRMEAITVASI